MNLARHAISATKPLVLYDVQLDVDAAVFTLSSPNGFAVYRSVPLELVRKREVHGGTLSLVVPCHVSSLLYLVGGGRSPRYPPNKVIFWDDVRAREVVELEFRERVRGLACRRGWLAVALRRRVVVFQIGASVSRYAEWDTYDNPRGLIAIATATNATLLAVPGRQIGHVQLIHLPPCRPPEPPPPPPTIHPPRHASSSSHPPPHPHLPRPSAPPLSTRPPSHSIIVAHNTALSTLAVPPSGRLVATTSLRGTLVRVWDVATGKQVRELRRGSDQAEIYGVAFRPDEAEICVWSDKGTVHVFALAARTAGSGPTNRHSPLSSLSSYLPLPKYFDSEWSYAQFRIPTQSAHISLSQASAGTPDPDMAEEEKCVVGWIAAPDAGAGTVSGAGTGTTGKEYQLLALTYSGGWYRLALPRSASAASASAASASVAGSSASSVHSSPSRKGKGKAGAEEKEKEKKESKSRDCVLLEYRRFGSWDGWT